MDRPVTIASTRRRHSHREQECSILLTLRRLGLLYEETLRAPGQDREHVARERQRWRMWQSYMDSTRFVCLDEMSVTTTMARRYGRAPKDEQSDRPDSARRRAYREKLDYLSLKRRVVEMARNNDPHVLLIKDKGSGAHLIQELSYSSQVSSIGITPQGDKFIRASSQSAQIKSGRALLLEAAPWLVDFQNEISAFPNGRHDDQVDSMSQSLNWMIKREYGVPRIRSLDGDD